MINMHIGNGEMSLELNGSDDLLIDELSTAVVRMLGAMEQSDGNPVKENLTLLILQLIDKSGHGD